MTEEIKKAETAAIAAQYELQRTIKVETFAIASESGGMGVIDSGKLSHALSKYLTYVHSVERRLYELLQKEGELQKEHDRMLSIVKAVADIGVDSGCGVYELEPQFIDMARAICEQNDID